MPAANYTSAERFQQEMALLFRHHPLVVGLSCELREPGAYVTTDIAGLPILVVRDQHGQARAFYNVC